MTTTVQTFNTREALEDKLLAMNYDDGVHPELACVDNNGTVFIACGTDQGDLMGIAYYLPNAEGYMHHYGTEVDPRDVDDYLLNWTPAFPVQAMGQLT